MNPSSSSAFDPEQSYQLYLDALLKGDHHRCREIFEQWLESTDTLRSLYDDLVRHSLYEVGELWEQGKISVATEHMATAISESLLNLTYPKLFATPRKNRSAIISCLSGEHHRIGAKMVADLFELNGWRGYFLGSNTPFDDLKSLVAEKRPDALALSAATDPNLDRAISAASEVHTEFPGLAILVGGRALHQVDRDRLEVLPGVRFLMNTAELENWIAEQN